MYIVFVHKNIISLVEIGMAGISIAAWTNIVVCYIMYYVRTEMCFMVVEVSRHFVLFTVDERNSI